MCFSPFPCKLVTCPWQAAQRISFHIPCQFFPHQSILFNRSVAVFLYNPQPSLLLYPYKGLKQCAAHKCKSNWDSYILYLQITQAIFSVKIFQQSFTLDCFGYLYFAQKMVQQNSAPWLRAHIQVLPDSTLQTTTFQAKLKQM